MSNELTKSNNAFWKANAQSNSKTMVPAVNIYENEDAITLVADMPGVTKDSLNLDINKDVLSIEGAIQLDIPDGAVPLHAEVTTRRYRRTFTLSRELDTSRIDAEVRDGLLTLRIPKTQEARPRKIEVKGG